MLKSNRAALMAVFVTLSATLHALGFTGVTIFVPRGNFHHVSVPVEIEIASPETQAPTRPSESPPTPPVAEPEPEPALVPVPVAVLAKAEDVAAPIPQAEAAKVDVPAAEPEEEAAAKSGAHVDEVQAASARRASGEAALHDEEAPAQAAPTTIASNSNGTAGSSGGNEGAGAPTGGVARAGSVGENGTSGDSMGMGGAAQLGAGLALVAYGLGGVPQRPQPGLILTNYAPNPPGLIGGVPTFNTALPLAPTTPGPTTQTLQCPMCGGPVCVDFMGDVKNCGGCAKACEDKQKCSLGACTGGDHHQFVIVLAQVPHPLVPPDDTEQKNQLKNLSIDLNGDGKIDNQFYEFVAALKSFTGGAFDVATELQKMVGTGALVILVDESPKNGPNQPLTIIPGLPDMPAPGNRTFKVDSKTAAVSFSGLRTDAGYDSTTPDGDLPAPLKITIRSSLLQGIEFTVPFRVHVLHAEPYYQGIDGADAPGIIVRLYGSIRLIDMVESLTSVGTFLTSILNSNDPKLNPDLKLFAKGLDRGCTDASGAKLYLGDDIVEPCEILETNGLKEALVPDLRVYDFKGKFHERCIQITPDTPADSLSFGFSFLGVRGEF